MFSDPVHNLEQLGIEKGNRVVDFGAGSGFYALEAAKLVGDKGKVYAVDIQKDLLLRLKNEAQKRRLLNIETMWGDVERVGGSKLSDAIADRVIVSNILFQVSDKTAFLQEISRVSKVGAKILVVDWSDSFNNLGPVSEQVITETNARLLFEEAGFSFDRSIRAGDHHYGLVFSKNV